MLHCNTFTAALKKFIFLFSDIQKSQKMIAVLQAVIAKLTNETSHYESGKNSLYANSKKGCNFKFTNTSKTPFGVNFDFLCIT